MLKEVAVTFPFHLFSDLYTLVKANERLNGANM